MCSYLSPEMKLKEQLRRYQDHEINDHTIDMLLSLGSVWFESANLLADEGVNGASLFEINCDVWRNISFEEFTQVIVQYSITTC